MHRVTLDLNLPRTHLYLWSQCKTKVSPFTLKNSQAVLSDIITLNVKENRENNGGKLF
jgi:hypothetical protein